MIKKILFALTLIALFVSCDEQSEKKIKARKAHILYFDKYAICDKIDSVRSNITVYIGEVNGHKMMYHLFEGKNKSSMTVDHLVDECKACKKQNHK